MKGICANERQTKKEQSMLVPSNSLFAAHVVGRNCKSMVFYNGGLRRKEEHSNNFKRQMRSIVIEGRVASVLEGRRRVRRYV